MILLGGRVLSGKLKFHMLFLEPEIKTEYEEDDNDSKWFHRFENGRGKRIQYSRLCLLGRLEKLGRGPS